MTPSPASPSTLARAAQRVAAALLARGGWTADLPWPRSRACVFIVYPHTSNWDFYYGYLAKLATGLPLRWIGKHTLFRWPVGGLLRRMGGIPVDRSRRSGLTAQLARDLEGSEPAFIAIAPEGTRARTDHLHTGFYRLAMATGAPLGLYSIDYGTRSVTLRGYLDLSGDEEADLRRIREAYAGVQAKFPENVGEIRFEAGGSGASAD